MCFHRSDGEPVQVWFRGAGVQRSDPQCSGQLTVAPSGPKPKCSQGTGAHEIIQLFIFYKSHLSSAPVTYLIGFVSESFRHVSMR